MNSKPSVFLRIMKDGKLLEMKQFTIPQIIFGREGDVNVVIPDAQASPIHAMIEEREHGKYYLCDLGSQLGTFVGSEKVVDVPLQTGDSFNIGLITVEFHIGVPKAKPGEVSVPASAPTAAPAAKPAEPAAPVHTQTHVKKSETPKKIPNEAPKTTARPLFSSREKIAHPEGGGAGISRVVSPYPSSPKSRRKAKGTFAPKSHADIEGTFKPSRGNVVEIVLTWKDRVLNTFHFDKQKQVRVGSHPDNDIILPVFGAVRVSHPLIIIDGLASIILTPDMTGEVIRERSKVSIDELRRKGGAMTAGVGHSYTLQQNEMIRINFGEGVVLLIRYVAPSPESRLAPILDLSVNQLTSLVVGLLGTLLFLFYVYLYAPTPPEKPEEETEPPRKAQFFYKKVEEVKVEEAAKGSAKQTIKDQEIAKERAEEGAAQEAMPNKSKSKERKLTAPNPGKDKGIQKGVAAKHDSAPKIVQPKDVSKSGILGVFGTKGVQQELNKSFQGTGAVAGLSKNARGEGAEAAGSGNIPGGGLRDTGAGGNGTATIGIAGVKTAGKGGGISGYGTGSLGSKKNATILAGSDEATFSGTIDKEAIRRVVQANLKQIKACYEKGLNKDPSLYGKIVIQWTIGGGGRVLEAGIKSTTMNASEVESCAVARLKTWKFPEPPVNEVAVVSYPFVFQAQE